MSDGITHRSLIRARGRVGPWPNVRQRHFSPTRIAGHPISMQQLCIRIPGREQREENENEPSRTDHQLQAVLILPSISQLPIILRWRLRTSLLSFVLPPSPAASIATSSTMVQNTWTSSSNCVTFLNRTNDEVLVMVNQVSSVTV